MGKPKRHPGWIVCSKRDGFGESAPELSKLLSHCPSILPPAQLIRDVEEGLGRWPGVTQGQEGMGAAFRHAPWSKVKAW